MPKEPWEYRPNRAGIWVERKTFPGGLAPVYRIIELATDADARDYGTSGRGYYLRLPDYKNTEAHDA